jgi:hypothetical protein
VTFCGHRGELRPDDRDELLAFLVVKVDKLGRDVESLTAAKTDVLPIGGGRAAKAEMFGATAAGFTSARSAARPPTRSITSSPGLPTEQTTPRICVRPVNRAIPARERERHEGMRSTGSARRRG